VCTPCHLSQPRYRCHLPFVVAAIRRGLADAGLYAGALQREHRLVRVSGFLPATDERIESILVQEPRREILEAAVVRPLRMPRDLSQRAPLRVLEARDREPPIVSGTRVDVVRRRRLVRRTVAVA